VREVLHPGSWDVVETPVAVAGVTLAAAMARRGFTA
jgi:hypothetical protein